MSAATMTVRMFDPLRDKTYQSTGLGRPIVDYLARKTNQGRRPRTLEDKERYLASLALTFPQLTIHELTASDLDHWLALQPASCRRSRGSHVNDFLKWGVRWSLIDRNPMDLLDPISAPKQKTYDIFLEPEIEQLTSLPYPDGPLILTLFDGSLRKGEARRLQGRHLMPEPVPGQLRIVGAKGDKDRLVPLTMRLSAALNDLARVEAIGPKDFFWYTRPGGYKPRRDRESGETSFHVWWCRCLDEAGVRYRNPHMTRHTFATRYLRAGGRLETLSLVMGHSSIKTTFDLYGHLDTRDTAIDIALLEA